MEKEKKTGYLLYDFMSKEMGLSGVALRVYALIYSFTRAGGDCHGSLEYIAERTQSSRTSVKRALHMLVTKGFVIKAQTASNRPCVYISTFDPQVQNGPANEALQVQNDPMVGPKWTGGGSKMDPNNKDNNKDYNKSNYLPTYDLQAEGGTKRISVLGKTGVVRMTFHQYACLVRTVGVIPTIGYIRKLEEQILRYPERKYPNHYKTILTWARQDFRLNAADEMLVREEE